MSGHNSNKYAYNDKIYQNIYLKRSSVKHFEMADDPLVKWL